MVKFICAQILAAHASTRERMPILEEFYRRLFARIGRPRSIIDVACGLNPFAFPWMKLPASTIYHAYDLHHPRVDLINHFFKLQGLQPLAVARDVLVHPPQEEADAAFLFKEAHRIEQRQRGANVPLWQALKVRYLVVSLPAESLSGKHNLMERQRALVQSVVSGQPWTVDEMIFENEMVFVIEKPHGA